MTATRAEARLVTKMAPVKAKWSWARTPGKTETTFVLGLPETNKIDCQFNLGFTGLYWVLFCFIMGLFRNGTGHENTVKWSFLFN